jgi:hypothetical protein
MTMVRFPISLFLIAALAAGSPAALAVTAVEVFAKTRHAVYTVIVTRSDPGVVDVIGLGSAVLIAPGRLVTNCHVLEGGKNFVISRSEDRVTERVVVAGYEKGKDLCEVDLAELKAGFDKPVEIAPADSLEVGAPVFAIGSPRGMELSISSGIVSGFRVMGAGVKLIQTTASITHGSSGGGLFDEQGRLVGITKGGMPDSQNLNFAVSAQYIRSAGIFPAELLKQRSAAVLSGDKAPQEISWERQERLKRQEQDAIAARKKEFDAPSVSPSGKLETSAPTSGPKPAAARKPIAARLAPYQSLGDNNLPARLYEQMAKKGQLTGLDDTATIRKVYEALIRQHIAEQLRWKEGGNYVSEFQIQLRRSGEVMFVIPAKPSGVERFDQEAQRAIGAASPLPVPQDNEAFDRMSEITIIVQTPERVTHAPAPVSGQTKKKPK